MLRLPEYPRRRKLGPWLSGAGRILFSDPEVSSVLWDQRYFHLLLSHAGLSQKLAELGGDTSQTPPHFPFPRKTHLRLASAFSVPVTNLRTLPRTHSLKLVLAPESSGPAPSLRVAQIWHARHSVLPSQAGGTRCDPPGGQAPGHNWRFP